MKFSFRKILIFFSKQEWLYNKQDEYADRLTNLVEIVTGLKDLEKLGEPWQVNIGICITTLFRSVSGQRIYQSGLVSLAD